MTLHNCGVGVRSWINQLINDLTDRNLFHQVRFTVVNQWLSCCKLTPYTVRTVNQILQKLVNICKKNYIKWKRTSFWTTVYMHNYVKFMSIKDRTHCRHATTHTYMRLQMAHFGTNAPVGWISYSREKSEGRKARERTDWWPAALETQESKQDA